MTVMNDVIIQTYRAVPAKVSPKKYMPRYFRMELHIVYVA